MLQVDRRKVNKIRKATERLVTHADTKMALDTLRITLHEAMRLEASTIPPYLTAAWSIQGENTAEYQNGDIRELILSIAKEEMLHMMGVANIIAAMGQPPQMANPQMVLDWGVDALPIGSNIVPSLAPFSMEILFDLFMEIEEPDDPNNYPVIRNKMAMMDAQHYATIGEFYEALIELIDTFPEDPFINGAEYPQIRMSFDYRIGNIDHAPVTDFQVTNRDVAKYIIHWIVDQGEGTKTNPMDGNQEPAHYYRFAEIYYGGRLIETSDPPPNNYAYDKAGQPIQCDFSKVWQFTPNPKMEDFPPDSRTYKDQKHFNEAYTKMFQQLQAFYDGNASPQEVRDSIMSMNTMADDAYYLYEDGTCPSFQWIDGEPPLIS